MLCLNTSHERYSMTTHTSIDVNEMMSIRRQENAFIKILITSKLKKKLIPLGGIELKRVSFSSS